MLVEGCYAVQDFGPQFSEMPKLEVTPLKEMTEVKIVFEEMALKELEADLLQKDFSSPEERERTLQEFYNLAQQLRHIHQINRRLREHLN